jgi:hypothetical protein
MRTIIFLLLGALIMFFVLKLLTKNKPGATSSTTKNFIALAKTPQAYELVKTNQFSNLSKTPEFRNFVSTLAGEQISAMSNALLGSIKTF